jgi:phenylpyruvate tautomerase PptA (4-oxalocrotonate tautomerase family)
MPILKIEIVGKPDAGTTSLARRLADAAGDVFGTPPGRTWVRLRALPASAYAENGGDVPQDACPVFVDVLHYEPPEGEARIREVAALTLRIGEACGRPAQNVHVLYQAPARGRIAFGGALRD